MMRSDVSRKGKKIHCANVAEDYSDWNRCLIEGATEQNARTKSSNFLYVLYFNCNVITNQFIKIFHSILCLKIYNKNII